ncbi:2Fe-2S iron-sulfur cluster-binding protein [Bradyrhizobium liaoningense]|uniref:2Fe-2S iron-sulfur cluster-binding protein n=1 Tax=Bradyrhizobium liaoningense TaxID=43992 RepID=UPI001BAE0ECE|nr:2Fe-2S iron-sulfur cluster-binding protein [Bradyrhizobium liaoningense]MBR0859133.1 2Fe-2S iron-sulfur cluster binding domain-containing protein [Bradyrhizobium liaoningense]
MPQVTYVHSDGDEEIFDVPVGQNLMHFATAHGIDGILGECGGSMMCATCHVYVEESWLERLPPCSQGEVEMLACAAGEVTTSSRLSCQITMAPELDGMILKLPKQQR